ncbi:MAG TPA: thioredoxin family protein [Balneolales bacterium]|nr:thioredoxin family protein [Balneolales bacterium]
MGNNVVESVITQDHIDKAIGYKDFRSLIDQLLADDKTTGENHSEAMLHYTKMNVQRMNRLDKTITIQQETIDKLNSIDEELIWLVLAEAWCGDVAQNLPVMAKMADASEDIQLNILLRDENLEVIDEFLTNGGRSIPKLVCLKADDLEVLGSWGPRPEPAQDIMIDFKENPGDRTKQDIVIDIQKWYAKDKAGTIQEEFRNLVDDWKQKLQ